MKLLLCEEDIHHAKVETRASISIYRPTMTKSLSGSSARRQLQRLLAVRRSTATETVSTTTPRRHFSFVLSQRCGASFETAFPNHQLRTRRLGENLTDLYIRSRAAAAATSQSRSNPFSTLTSNAFWKSLDDAVEQGDGAAAQEMVDQVVQEYQNRIRNGPPTTTNTREKLDHRMFSMVLQAWKNGTFVPFDSAMRAQTLLGRMVVLAKKGLLDDNDDDNNNNNTPTCEDYMSVLECWEHATGSGDGNVVDHAKSLRHVDAIWEMVQQKEDISASFQEDLHKVYLDILANAGQGERAEECLMEYKRQLLVTKGERINGVDALLVNADMCLSVLRAYAQSKETSSAEQAERFLQIMWDDKSLPNPDTVAYNIVLDGWIAAAKRDYAAIAERVENLLTEMKKMRVQPNAASYQYGMEILARMGEGARAEALLTSLLKEYTIQFDADLKPDITPFRTVLWAYSNCHHPDAASQAESVLKNMAELGESDFATCPTTLDYNLVLKCWARSRSPDAVERAMALYDEMVSASSATDTTERQTVPPPPDTTSLNTVLNVSSHRERAHQTENLLWKFFDRHFHDPSHNPCPDTVSFGTVMTSWSKAKGRDAPERAEKLLEKLEELYRDGNENCKPDVFVYSILMNCWSRAQRSRKEAPMRSLSIFRRLQELAREGHPEMVPDAACWNLAISAWIGNGKKAEALFMEMLEEHRDNPDVSPAPNAKTLTKVFHAWAKTRSRDASDRAIDLLGKLEQLHQEGSLSIKPHAICYSLVLEALSQDRSLSSAMYAEKLLHKMKLSPDPAMRPMLTCYNWVIKTWAFAAHPEAVPRATELLKEVIRQAERNEKMRPNEKTFGGVLKALAVSNLPDKQSRAEAVLALMDKFDCKPDKWIRNVLEDCFVGRSGNVPETSAEGMKKKSSDKAA